MNYVTYTYEEGKFEKSKSHTISNPFLFEYFILLTTNYSYRLQLIVHFCSYEAELLEWE